MIRNVIFDLDGTLIDSVEAHAQAWSRAFAAYGKRVPVEEIRQQIGKGGDQLMPVFLTPEEHSALGEALEEHRGQLFRREYMPHVRPFPMVVPLFERLVADGKRVALGSSSAKEDLDYFIGLLGIRRFLDASTNADDVEESKPEPDVFLEALRRLGHPRKDDVIVVGDAPWDAIAAGRAGLRTVGLLGGGFSEEQLRTAGCVAVYQDVADLFQAYERSPLV